MSGILDIFSSERGVFAVLLVIGSTILTAMGKMTVEAWQAFATTTFGIYVAGKTVTTAVGFFKRPAIAAAAVAPAAEPVKTEAAA